MLQLIGVIVALLGLAYNGVKDYQNGNIKLPVLQEKQELTKPVYPIQYCLVAYDPNTNKLFYQHENGQWYDYPPQQRRYPSETQPSQNQTQGQAPVAVAYGAPGTSGYGNGQPSQTSPYATRY